MLESDRPHKTTWRMRIACWVPKATNTCSEYVILTAFSQQQWLHERASLLRLYVRCLCWSSVSVVTRLQSGRAGKQGFDSRQGSYFSTAPQLPHPPYSPSSPLCSGYLAHYSPRPRRIARSLSVTTHLFSELQNVWKSSTSTPMRHHDVVLN